MSWTPNPEEYKDQNGNTTRTGLESYAKDLYKSGSDVPTLRDMSYVDRQIVQKTYDNESK